MKRIIALLTLFFMMACGTGITPPLSTPEAGSVVLASSTPSATPTSTHPPTNDFVVIGYLPDYRTLNPAWAQTLTDIIYFSAEPRSDGTLDTSRFNPETLAQLNLLKQQSGLRVHISVGGWERSTGFGTMTSNIESRQRFVENLTRYLLENDLDGVDFDWEFPEDNSQLKNYIALLTESKAALEPLGMNVSVALSPDNKDLLGEFAIADRIHIMSYDRGPQHSTYEQAVADLQTFLDAGLPRVKLILGVPFYGRKETPPYAALSYAEIMQLYNPPASVDEVDGIFFNGIETIQRKVCLTMRERIAGVMIWELSQDTVDATSLLRAIERIKTEGCVP